MNKPIISICIPTYNRVNYLKKSIDSIICQPEFKSGEVEIIISDNASTDGTEELGKKYESDYDNVKYYRNSDNISIENFPLALSRGQGIYRKLSNDTFIYYTNSMRFMCDFVKSYKDDRKILFFLNKNRKNIKEEIIKCCSFDEFADIACTWTTWSGGFGLWEDECNKITSDLSGCDQLLWQCVQIYKMVAESQEAIINNQKLLSVQSVENKDLTYGLYMVLYVYFADILKTYLNINLLKQATFDKICYEQLRIFFTGKIIQYESNIKSERLSEDEDLKTLVFDEIKSRFDWQHYKKYYARRKTAFLIRQKIKAVLKKLHIWDILVALHIKKQ